MRFKFGRFYKRGKTWYIDYFFKRKKYMKSTGESVKCIAEEFLQNKRQKLFDENEVQNYEDYSEPSFKDVAEEWLDNYSRIFYSKSHYSGNRIRLDRYIYNYFEVCNLTEISQKEVLKFLALMKIKEVMSRRISPDNSEQYI